MPSSNYHAIPTVLNLVNSIKPKSILDIGIGTGKYGLLFREYLDVWNVKTPYDSRETEIVGVEIFEDYRTPVWDMYDKVYIGNALEVPEIYEKTYDLLFLGDVIEHFEIEDALTLFKKLKYRNIIIVTPIRVSAQKAVYSNEYEKHISSWSENCFSNLKTEKINNIQVFYNGILNECCAA